MVPQVGVELKLKKKELPVRLISSNCALLKIFPQLEQLYAISLLLRLFPGHGKLFAMHAKSILKEMKEADASIKTDVFTELIFLASDFKRKLQAGLEAARGGWCQLPKKCENKYLDAISEIKDAMLPVIEQMSIWASLK